MTETLSVELQSIPSLMSKLILSPHVLLPTIYMHAHHLFPISVDEDCPLFGSCAGLHL